MRTHAVPPKRRALFARVRIFKVIGAASLAVLCFYGGSLGKGGAARVSVKEFREQAGIEMVSVKGGTFRMGCTPEQADECGDDETPVRRVKVGKFSIGKYEITQRQWKFVMGDGNNPSEFKGDDLPVENVSWNDVQEFIERLNKSTGKKYRLPTEAEWEYAARGGPKSKGYKYSGSNNVGDVAWYYENSGDLLLDDNYWELTDLKENNNRTHPVGAKLPNELGIYDMSGNVWEWVSDWYGAYGAEAKANPAGPPSGSHRVYRGGSWVFGAKNCRVSFRFDVYPDFRYHGIGFRLASSSHP